MTENRAAQAAEVSDSPNLWTEDSRLDRVILRVSSFFGAVSGFGYVVLMIVMVADVLTRQFGGRGIGGSVDITEVTLAGLVYLGMSAAETGENHVRTPLLTNRLPARVGNTVRAISLTIASAFILWLTFEAVPPAIESIVGDEYRFGIVSIPIWPSRVAIVIGLAVFAIVLILETWKTVRRVIRGQLIQFEMQDLP